MNNEKSIYSRESAFIIQASSHCSSGKGYIVSIYLYRLIFVHVLSEDRKLYLHIIVINTTLIYYFNVSV